ncbi:hypothetical protein A2690_00280 [Candidatus Roizmanbacteria bacterium RIFCSPHIGHO2_01_FULL_39_12b]|uniref:Cell division protein FtsL n=1 Tax=Candidatus Roizmanbacteria bacterium RIFCSPHIGHO2_01_FULL_39_12b TaxID=1802030 RepID=A0A1F7G8J7_9BACT|nr:MAG: hypothetical protein A2690_00280 [Candidatus Roizmanbacteria bacterium RIFCSPHIGHO2_01_FULL_39_12b]OGK46003.1 MAG: hypothetical protein A3B46_00570 [Candidatus Roizmanbacteria bacterium RIFCSPLOWO2_01_FULL_39_19]
MIQTIKNIAFFFVAAALIASLTNSLNEYRKKQNFYNTYEKQLQNERVTNKKLKSKIAQSRDYFIIEEIIREKLNKTKPNEYIIIMPPPKQVAQSISQHTKPTYRQWMDLFFY